jgi:hypothetical protein
MNYTPEQTEYIVSEYSNEPQRETVNRLSEELGKTVKSIIGKLSREGVYRREVYVTKMGQKPVTKIEIVENIAEALEMDGEELKGLDKTPKLVLKKLESKLCVIQAHEKQ